MLEDEEGTKKEEAGSGIELDYIDIDDQRREDRRTRQPMIWLSSICQVLAKEPLVRSEMDAGASAGSDVLRG